MSNPATHEYAVPTRSWQFEQGTYHEHRGGYSGRGRPPGDRIDGLEVDYECAHCGKWQAVPQMGGFGGQCLRCRMPSPPKPTPPLPDWAKAF